MSWRAIQEPHLLGGDPTTGTVNHAVVFKTLNRATIGLNYGYDADFGIGRMLPRLSNPSFNVSIEGWVPDDKAFITKLLRNNIGFVLTDPVTDPNFLSAIDHVARGTLSNDGSISYNLIGAFTLGPNRLQVTLNDSGISFSMEWLAVDESRGTATYTKSGDNETRSINLLEPKYIGGTLNFDNSFSAEVLGTVYPPEIARESGILVINDMTGNQISVLASSVQITADFGAEVRYTVNGLGTVLARDIPRVEIELELIPDQFTPAEFNKLALQIMQSTAPTKIIIADNVDLAGSNHAVLELDVFEYVVQTDDYEASADFTSPRFTIIPLRYVMKDGVGNVLFGWA